MNASPPPIGTRPIFAARASAAFAVLLLLRTFLPGRVGAAQNGSVRGQVFVSTAAGVSLGETVKAPLQMVVFLEPQDRATPPLVPQSHPSMHQKNASFTPPFLVAVKGQSVDFPNDDPFDHNVFSFSAAKKFDLGVYPKGQTKSVTFDREGPVVILCSVHENMNAVIYVVPNAFYALTDERGRFEIRDVPPGRYLLRTWHPSLPSASRRLEMPSPGKGDVEVPLDLFKNIDEERRAP